MTTKFITATPARANLDHSKENTFPASFSFHPSAAPDQKRAPLDIAVAMDVSGSMMGSKIEYAKKSLLKLVEHLSPQDRLCIVAFTGHVFVVTEPMLVTAENRKEFQKRIASMDALDMTNLSGGVLKALELLKGAAPLDGAVRRCMVFTDGMANQGITDPEHLAKVILEFRGKIGISTFGYGQDHDSALLEKLAQDGAFYFVNNPDAILSAFGTELGGLLTTAAQNVTLRLTPAKDVEIVKVLNDLTVTDDNGTAVIHCDDLLAEQEYSVVVDIKTAVRANAHPRPVNIIKATVSYFDVALGKIVTEDVSLKVKFVKPGEEDTVDDPKVMNEVALQKAVAAQAEAQKCADAGDIHGAQRVLRNYSMYAMSIGTPEAESLSLVSDDMAESNYGDMNLYRTKGAHEARSIHKAFSTRRSMGAVSKGGVDLGDMLGTAAVNQTSEAFSAPAVPPPPPVADPVEDEEPCPPPVSTGSFSRNRSRW